MGLLFFLIVTITIPFTAQNILDSVNDSGKSELVLSKIIGKALSSALKTDGQANIIVTMENATDSILSDISSSKFDSRQNLTFAVLSGLKNHARESQKHIIEFLQQKDHDHISFWISNEIFIKNATIEVVNNLLSMNGIEKIELEEVFPLPEPVEIEEVTESDPSSGVKGTLLWNMEHLGIPCAWKEKNTGEGIIVSNVDTGVLGKHEILEGNHRLELGWYDPTFKPSLETENITAAVLNKIPSDNNGHGTHTMGTIAGANGFGVAPGAKWIACKACAKSCKQADLTLCMQFILCPHQPGSPSVIDGVPCAGAPHVVNNSWGGGQGTKTFEASIKAWRTAGIIPVFSQGNSGPKCRTAKSPGDSQYVIGVGATNSTRGISKFSSKGPSVEEFMKPDISAPGEKIKSSWKTNSSSYATISGTSMAAPHVTGVVALILSSGMCNEHYKVAGSVNGNNLYDCVYHVLTKYASYNYTKNTLTCNGVKDDSVPNYSYGYGIVDAYASLMLEKGKICSN